MRPALYYAGTVQETMEDALAHGASVPLVPCTDSLKRISSGKMIWCRQDRYFRTQTPASLKRHR